MTKRSAQVQGRWSHFVRMTENHMWTWANLIFCSSSISAAKISRNQIGFLGSRMSFNTCHCSWADSTCCIQRAISQACRGACSLCEPKQGNGASQVAQWWRTRLQCRRHRFNLWVRKMRWRRAWQPTAVFLPWKNPINRGAWWATVQGLGCKESDMTEHKKAKK